MAARALRSHIHSLPGTSPGPAHSACTAEHVRAEGQLHCFPGVHPRAALLSAGCGRTGDFTIHDAEDGVSLLAGWVVEQRQQRAASSGDGKQKLVCISWPDACVHAVAVLQSEATFI